MRFVEGEFSEDEQKILLENHKWMEDYYGQLKGAVIEDVGISIDEGHNDIAFLSMNIKLANGVRVDTEVVSVRNVDEPGVIVGLPTDHLK